jgi:hypothetical protein
MNLNVVKYIVVLAVLFASVYTLTQERVLVSLVLAVIAAIYAVAYIRGGEDDGHDGFYGLT